MHGNNGMMHADVTVTLHCRSLELHTSLFDLPSYPAYSLVQTLLSATTGLLGR